MAWLAAVIEANVHKLRSEFDASFLLMNNAFVVFILERLYVGTNLNTSQTIFSTDKMLLYRDCLSKSI